MDDDLTDLDAGGLLAAASEAVRARRLPRFMTWKGWLSRPQSTRATRDALVRLGGEGTPGVQDFCLGEIALARGSRRSGDGARSTRG